MDQNRLDQKSPPAGCQRAGVMVPAPGDERVVIELETVQRLRAG